MFQPLGRAAEVSEDTLQALRDHRRAMRASKAGNWSEARELFTRLRDEWEPATMYERYLRGIDAATGTVTAADGEEASSPKGSGFRRKQVS